MQVEEAISLPASAAAGKRPRQQSAADVGAVAAAATAAATAAAGSLPPFNAIKACVVEVLNSEGQDTLAICRQLRDRLHIRISSISELTRSVNKALYQLQGEGRSTSATAGPHSSKKLWRLPS